MNISLAVTYTGAADAEDVLGARQAIAVENKLRVARNAIAGATQESMLPTTTAGEIKASYLSVLAAQVAARHRSYILEAQTEASVRERFTPDEWRTIVTNLNTRLNNGEAAAAIITDTAG